MAKPKKAFGRQIARWKQEAIAANAGASDEDLAKIINEMAKAQGYGYKISPEKVRAKTKKKRKKRKRAATAAPAVSATTAPAPASKSAATAGISVGDIEAIKGLVDRIGADNVQELAGVLAG